MSVRIEFNHWKRIVQKKWAKLWHTNVKLLVINSQRPVEAGVRLIQSEALGYNCSAAMLPSVYILPDAVVYHLEIGWGYEMVAEKVKGAIILKRRKIRIPKAKKEEAQKCK